LAREDQRLSACPNCNSAEANAFTRILMMTSGHSMSNEEPHPKVARQDVVARRIRVAMQQLYSCWPTHPDKFGTISRFCNTWQVLSDCLSKDPGRQRLSQWGRV
jgi:hypothetical protein